MAHFGPRVLWHEVHYGLHYRFIEWPDLVMAPRYYKEVHRHWFIFEKEVESKRALLGW